jgi:Calcineurin-like phosphoesterase superfamily domain
MKIIIVSDTHENHEELGVLRGDVLIHCGDSGYGFRGTRGSVDRLDAWFGRQAFELILCIGENHDFELQEISQARDPVFRNALYLEDEAVRFKELTFYGTPWVPELSLWAYHLPPNEIREKWERIPQGTDVLITHSPPRGVLDRNRRGKSCGCPELLRRVVEVKPRLHCFGHVHASAGILDAHGTTFVNASVVNSQYQIARRPVEFET